MLEVLTAGVIAALMALPVVTLLFTSTHESVVSEDYMFAVAIAQRYLAEAMCVPWAELEELMPYEKKLEGLPEEDEVYAKDFPSYEKNITGEYAFKGKLTVRSVEDGLAVYEISLTWPVKAGASGMRKYAIIRLRCRHDIAISTNFPIQKPYDKAKGI